MAKKYRENVTVMGNNLFEMPRKKHTQFFVQKITIVSRDPSRNLNWQLPLEEQLREILELTEGESDGPVIQQRMDQYRQMTGWREEEWRKAPPQLSPSQRLWAALSLDLARRTPGYFLDEPFWALDGADRRRFGALLRRLTGEEGAAVVIFSEDRRALAQVCNRVVDLSAEPGGMSDCSLPQLPPRPAEEGEPLLTLDGVTAGPEGLAVLQGVCLTVRAGTCVGILGGAASGKTTLGRVAAGLYPAQRGRILWHGREASGGEAARQWRQRVQTVFQDVWTALNPSYTVGKTLAEGMAAGGRRAEEKDILAELAFWGLPPHLMGQKNRLLTMEQRRRVNAARAFCRRPALVVLDDCFRGVGESARTFWWDRLHHLQRRDGTALLLITDETDWHRAMSDELVILDAGAVIERGETVSVLEQPGQEQTRQLLRQRGE